MESDKVIVRHPTPEEIKEAKAWPIWCKEVSKFDWTYGDKETCLILEGEVEVTNKHGNNFSFKEGDYVIFPTGMSCFWNVKRAVKKHYNFG